MLLFVIACLLRGVKGVPLGTEQHALHTSTPAMPHMSLPELFTTPGSDLVLSNISQISSVDESVDSTASHLTMNNSSWDSMTELLVTQPDALTGDVQTIMSNETTALMYAAAPFATQTSHVDPHSETGSKSSATYPEEQVSYTSTVSNFLSNKNSPSVTIESFTNVIQTANSTGLNINETIASTESLNVTNQLCNGTNSTACINTKEVPGWSKVFDLVQLTCTLLGFVVNVMTVITLYRNPRGFSRLILTLFRHQSLVDSLVCAMASAVMLQPFHWLSGNEYFDVFVCHAWHSQAFYWGAVTLSTYNLMIISLERYLAVIHPFKHAQLSGISGRKMAAWCFFLYVLCVLVTHGTYIQTRLKDGQCINEYAFDGPEIKQFFFAFVIFTYIATYLVPVVVMATMYSLISRALHVRMNDTALGHSKLVDRAGAQVTKTAISVTVVFIVSIGYDLHYYLLGHTGVVDYKLNTPYQKVGVFLSNMNSCVNPFIYAIVMPIFRHSMTRTFCCKPDHRTMTSNSSSKTPSKERQLTSTHDTTVSEVDGIVNYDTKF